MNDFWVSAKERSPLNDGRYLVCGDGEIYIASYEKGYKSLDPLHSGGWRTQMPEYWRHLPDPPRN